MTQANYKESNILAFDTATENLSVSVYSKGHFASKHEVKPRQHGALLLHWIEALLGQLNLSMSDIDFLVFGRGPGAFTGVRIACGVAQGLSFGAKLPVIPVSSLLAMAYRQLKTTPYVFSAIDARMEQVYCAGYALMETGVEHTIVEQVIAPTDLPKLDNCDQYVALGTGSIAYEAQLKQATGATKFNHEPIFPCAQSMIEMVLDGVVTEIIQPNEIEAVYLRNDVAKKKKQQ
jgi:tRNA threonylcarbamoyladenosine biosynthesis protein TsaB